MKQLAKVTLSERFGGEQAYASVGYGDGIIGLELWQDRVKGEEPYEMWLSAEDARTMGEALLAASQRAASI